jgi:hypothetical protein
LFVFPLWLGYTIFDMALPDPANDDLAKQGPTPPAGYTPSTSGERKEAIVGAQEKAPIVERVPPRELGPEVKDWLTKLETGEEIQLPQPVTDDSGQPLVSPPASQQVTVTLPLTEEEMKFALHQKVIDSIRWLAEWMKRVLKIAGGKFIYKVSK